MEGKITAKKQKRKSQSDNSGDKKKKIGLVKFVFNKLHEKTKTNTNKFYQYSKSLICS